MQKYSCTFHFLFSLLCLVLIQQGLCAQEKATLRANHPYNGLDIIYQFEFDGCTNWPKSPSVVQVYNNQNNNLREANLLEKTYFGINEEYISDDEFSFTLNSLSNVLITFTPTLDSNGQCSYIKSISFEGKSYFFKSLKINYFYRLGFPTLDNIEFYDSSSDQKNPILIVESYQARGYLPFYEMKVGVALKTITNIRPSNKRDFHRQNPIFEPMPLMMLRYGPIFLNNDGLGSVLLPYEHFSILAAFILEGEPYEADNLRSRRQLLFFGPLIKSHFLEVHYYREIQNKHRGEVLKITIAPEFEIQSNYTLQPRLYYQYWDQRYVDYYFGVDINEAPFHGGQYKASQARNWGFEIQNTLKYKKFDYLVSAGMKYYGDAVRNSPLTIKGHEYRLYLGLMYNLL